MGLSGSVYARENCANHEFFKNKVDIKFATPTIIAVKRNFSTRVVKRHSDTFCCLKMLDQSELGIDTFQVEC